MTYQERDALIKLAMAAIEATRCKFTYEVRKADIEPIRKAYRKLQRIYPMLREDS